MKQKIIFSRRVAQALKQEGFEIIDIRQNKFHPEYTCYVFEWTEECEKAFKHIIINL